MERADHKEEEGTTAPCYGTPTSGSKTTQPAASGPAFPLWVNQVPAITELTARATAAAGGGASSLLSIRELFRCNTSDPEECWDYVLLSSYMTDLEWLLTSVPELSCVRHRVVVLSGDKGTATLRHDGQGSYAATSAAMDRVNPFLAALRSVATARASQQLAAASRGQEAARVLSRDRFAALEPPLPIAFGTHHTKMAVCVNRRGVRVSIFTANLLEQDWCWKTQGIYCQDFPWRSATAVLGQDRREEAREAVSGQANAKAADFEHQLRQYWRHCGLDMTAAFTRDGAAAAALGIFSTDFLSHVDFTDAKVWLIASVPGSHSEGEAGAGFRVGLCRLSEVLAKSAAAPTLREPAVLSWQYSSQGSLHPFFLAALQAAMRGAPAPVAAAGATPPASVVDVQVIYPTEAEVQDSFEGWRGGGSLPLRVQNCHEFVNERLHRWGCGDGASALTASTTVVPSDTDAVVDVDADGAEMESEGELRSTSVQGAVAAWGCEVALRQHAMPHIKSYAAMNAERTGLHWFVLTSANLSQAAWGSFGAKPTAKRAAPRLLVRSYELGVLYDACSAWESAVMPFCVTPSSIIALPTRDNSAHALFATPFCCHSRTGALSPPLLFLPYKVLRPCPYASTAALRSRNSSSAGGTDSAVGAALLSTRDVPWVMDMPHRGLDAYGRDVERAFEERYLPPLSRWQPAEQRHRSKKRLRED